MTEEPIYLPPKTLDWYSYRNVMPCMIPWAIDHGVIPAPVSREDLPEEDTERFYEE